MTRFRSALLAVLACFAAGAPLWAQRAPAPRPTGLPPEVLALACAPTLATAVQETPLRITGGQDSAVRRSHGPGDLITINAGTRHGIEVGQEFYARRVQVTSKQAITRDTPASVRTTGWIKVYAVDTDMSLATITHACDAVDVGDYLEPFALPVVPVPVAERLKAERDNYARVLTGSDRRESFGKGDFFLVDRGSNQGVTPGARFVVYRDKRQDGNFLFDLGEAVAVDVRPDSSTLQVIVSRDAFRSGDYAALRK